MKNIGKVVLKMGLLSLLSVIPLAAQMGNGVDFTTSFPFYAGNTKMPAGFYTITQSDSGSNVLRIKSIDGAHSASVNFLPTDSEQPRLQSDVTFRKYGNTEYLNRVWLDGQRHGMKVAPTKNEIKAAASANVVEHSISANNSLSANKQ